MPLRWQHDCPLPRRLPALGARPRSVHVTIGAVGQTTGAVGQAAGAGAEAVGDAGEVFGEFTSGSGCVLRVVFRCGDAHNRVRTSGCAGEMERQKNRSHSMEV